MATKRWVGKALPVAQLQRMTFAGTWVAGDTITLTMNGKAIVITLGSVVDLVSVAQMVAAAWNGNDAELNETRTGKGTDIPEFQKITATANVGADGRVELTGEPGTPFTVTVSETSTSGTVTNSTITQATGPNHWDNNANWIPTGEPANGDDVVFDSGSVSVLWALNTGGLIPASFKVQRGYTGNIGLPVKRNRGLDTEFHEYLDRYLILGASGAAIVVEIGRGDGAGSQRINLDFSTQNFTASVYSTGQPEIEEEPAVAIKGGGSTSILRVYGGNVGGAYFADETLHIGELTVGSSNTIAGDAKVICGAGANLLDSIITINGGSATYSSATTAGSRVDVHGGELTIRDGAQLAVNSYGGTIYYESSGTITTYVGYGAIDFTRGAVARTITTSNIYRGAVFMDSYRTVTFTNPLQVNCTYREVDVDLGPVFKLTR